MFAIVGFVALVIVMIGFSILAAGVGFNMLGRWNIGGRPNTWADRGVAIAFISLVIFLWVKLVQHAPFTITLN
jgi:divalent metal cation (Fe/Co/Zn/Cd) transporter